MSDRKKAIVTGASIGMGRGIALVLAEEGYDIAFSYYGDDEQSLKYVDKTVSMLKEKGAKSWHFSADLTKKGAPKEFFDKAVSALGGLDLLVNSAGVNMPLPLQELTEENIDYLFALDQKAYVMLMHYAACYMIDNGIRGCMVNVSSSRGDRAYPNAGIYCGIKAGLNRMIEAFALDVAGYGIRINNVSPGATRVRTKVRRRNCSTSKKEGLRTTSGMRRTSSIPKRSSPTFGTSSGRRSLWEDAERLRT